MVEEEPVRDDDVTDELPEDLDASGLVGPYLFPNNNRRRIPAALYLLIGLGSIALWASTRNGDPVLVNSGKFNAFPNNKNLGTFAAGESKRQVFDFASRHVNGTERFPAGATVFVAARRADRRPPEPE